MLDNKISIEFQSLSQNEGFARVAISAFIAQLDPTIDEMADVKTAVSEAVTNSIIHGYENKKDGIIRIEACISGNNVTIKIVDFGKGMTDVEKAMEPLFTTKAEAERSGMGFSFMEAFMDSLEVESTPGKGTLVKMSKIIGKGRKIWTTQSL